MRKIIVGLFLALLCSAAFAEPVYTCNIAATGNLNSCPVTSQWTLVLDPTKVAADARVLHAAQPCSVGKQDMARCTPTWTVLSTIPDGDLIGVCFDSTSTSNVITCAVSNGGGEGYQVKSVAIGGVAPAPTPAPTPAPAPTITSSLTQAAANAIGSIRTAEAKIKVGPDPDCVADKTVTDKTTCHKAVTIVGKTYVKLAGFCFPLDTDKAATNDSYQVTPSSSTSTSRPLYDVTQYMSAGTLKEIGRAPNGAICTDLILAGKQYRKVTVNGIAGMAICGLVPGKQILVSHGWIGLGDEMVKYPAPQSEDCPT